VWNFRCEVSLKVTNLNMKIRLEECNKMYFKEMGFGNMNCTNITSECFLQHVLIFWTSPIAFVFIQK